MGKTDRRRPLIPGRHGIYPRKDFGHVFIIGLAGLAGSGKTTIAQAIVAELNRDEAMPAGLKLSFAQRIKEVLAALVGDKQITFNRPEEKAALLYGSSDWDARKFLQLFASEFCRDQIGTDLWVDIVAERICQLKQPTVIPIDDLRFLNELKMVQALGQPFLLKRSGAGGVAQHRSEEPGKLAIKTVIDNDSGATPSQVAREILAIARQHPLWPPASKRRQHGPGK